MTSEPIIRLLTMDDAPRAAKLWALVFGDDEQLVHGFFRLFGQREGFGACAEVNGQIVAAAYAPDGTDYVTDHGTVRKGVYLYAVATHPDYRERGLARKICSLLKETAWAQGCRYLFTRPSEESLYSWYEEKIGAVPLLGCQTLQFEREGCTDLPCEKLSADAYSQLRSKHLTGLPHVAQSAAWFSWEQLLHEAYGGGFYVVGSHIADIYCDGTSVHVNELLPHPTLQQAEAVCQTLMTATGTSKCTCLLHGRGHYVSVAENGCELPRDNGWFGPCYA